MFGYRICYPTQANCGLEWATVGITGTALNELIEERADQLSFLFDQLGIQFAEPLE